MNLIKEYKNEEIPEAYLIMFMCNTIFLGVHAYCAEIIFNKYELFSIENSIILQSLMVGFTIGLLLVAIVLNVVIYLGSIIRYAVIKFRKTIDNKIENSYLSFVQHFLLTNCLLLIFNLVLIKTL